MSGLLILFYQEAMINGTNVVQCLAKKPIDKDAIKYDFLNMHSKSDKPHPKSRQMELAEQLFKK
ncbi:MAG: hypothetical protein R3B45_04210 [Bdellovibrionota bacterium]